MGRYPRAIRAALRLIASVHRVAPFLAPRRMRWPQREKRFDALYRAGDLFAMRRAFG